MSASVQRDQLIARLRAAAEKLGKRSVSRLEFQRVTGISPERPAHLFGSFNKFVAAAGLVPNDWPRRIADEDLMRALRDLCVEAGAVVSKTYVAEKGRHHNAYRRRWGNWRSVLLALRDWCQANDPGFPHLAALPRPGIPDLPRSLRPAPPRRYGAPLNFRGLLHAPVNEPGVVLLFGALAEELGFAVEHVTGGFPDCEAKRRTADGWARVRIEFEYESRNFRTHRHDPQGCDLIVCWQHNWPDCPVEVIALREEVQKRAAGAA